MEHVDEVFDFLGLDGEADVAVGAVGGDEFFAFGVEDGEPGDAAGFVVADFSGEFLAADHAILVDDFSDFGDEEEVVEFVAPAAPGGADTEEYFFVLSFSLGEGAVVHVVGVEGFGLAEFEEGEDLGGVVFGSVFEDGGVEVGDDAAAVVEDGQVGDAFEFGAVFFGDVHVFVEAGDVDVDEFVFVGD